MAPVLKNDFDWPIKYIWQGTFRYPLKKEDGHQWLYHDRDSWEIWRLKSRMPEEFQETPESLVSVAKKILSKEVFEKIPDAYRNDNLFPFTQWLASSEEVSQHVKRGLSVVLNSIVIDATLKSFRIVTTFVNPNATVHIQGLKPSEPQWFYLNDPTFPNWREEDMLVEPRMFFELSDGKISKTKPASEFEASALMFKYARVLHNYTVTDFHVREHEIELTLKDQVTICRYNKGALCGCIPVPGEPKSKGIEPEDVMSPEVVVESPVVRKALMELSRIWQDRNTKKSVLISAPPGSGKEVFCSGIVYGNGRPTKNFQSLSMASDDQEGLEKLLLGDENSGVLRQGLIKKAAKSGIFLDEVHQPEKTKTGNNSAARAALLRPLEAGEFTPKGSSTVDKVDDVLFIMATSKSHKELKAFNPPDFWTRMTHFVDIPHPLKIYTDETQKNFDDSQINVVLEKFFNFFWWERVENFYTSRRGEDKHLHNYSEKLLTWQRKALQAVVERGWSKETVGDVAAGKIKMSQPKPGVVFAKVLRNVLNRQKPKILPHECSIRGIRNMVCRLFYIAATRVSQGEEVLVPPREFKKIAKDLAEEIVPIANICPNKRSKRSPRTKRRNK